MGETPDYGPGDTIEVDMGSYTRTVYVMEREPDIKNGEPGFDGKLVREGRVSGMSGGVWGYDSQVLRIVSGPSTFLGGGR